MKIKTYQKPSKYIVKYKDEDLKKTISTEYAKFKEARHDATLLFRLGSLISFKNNKGTSYPLRSKDREFN